MRSARATLVVLTALNFLNYIDRQVLPAVLEQLKVDVAFRHLGETELGLLQTAFLVTYMIVSPVSGLAATRLQRKLLVAMGVGVWSLATVASGLARNYPELLVARAFIGVGEASYATVAPAMLSDLYAPDRRARILAIFYLATPVGSAMGFLLGGWVAEIASWRAAFLVAGGPGLACALAALLTREPERGAMDPPAATRITDDSFGERLRVLVRSREYLYLTIGTTLWVWSVGGLVFWLPTYFQEVRHLSSGQASTAVGGIAVVTGIVGTIAGRWIADRRMTRDPGAYYAVSAWGLAIAAPLSLAVPLAPSLAPCLVGVFLSQLCVFLNTGPLNTALVNAVPASARELGVGLNVLCIHLAGDAISPPILGALQKSLRHHGLSSDGALAASVAVTALPLAASAAVLFLGARVARNAATANL